MGSRRGRFKAKWVPERGHPIIRFMIEEINRQRRNYEELAETSGVARNFAHSWRRGADPKLTNIDAVLNALGYRLIVEKIDDDKHP